MFEVEEDAEDALTNFAKETSTLSPVVNEEQTHQEPTPNPFQKSPFYGQRSQTMIKNKEYVRSISERSINSR